MKHTKSFAAGRSMGLALSLLLTIGGCAGSTGSTADAPCTDCGPTVAPPAPEGFGLTDAPELHVAIDGSAELSASLSAATIRVRAGSETTLEVRIDRRDFGGEVVVWTEGLPEGVISEAAVMPAAVPSGRLVVGATEGAALGPHPFTVVVSASGVEPVEMAARVVVAGAPGTLDETFGASGVAAFEGRSVGVNAVAVDSRGRVFATGRDWDERTMFFERLRADGSLDAAYAEAARAVLPDEEFSSGSRMVLVSDEARVLMTAGSYDATEVRVDLVSFDDDGQPDAAIGVHGVVPVSRIPIHGAGSFALTEGAGSVFFRVGDRFAGLRPDGEVVDLSLPEGAEDANAMAYWNHTLTFGVVDGDSDAPASLERVHTAGGHDERFGAGGVLHGRAPATADFYESRTFEVALGEDGSGYAATIQWSEESGALSEIVRFTAAGEVDESFGEGGRVTFGSEGERVSGLIIDSAGRPVVFTEHRPSFARRLRRFTSNGQPDRSFGSGGTVDLGSMGLRSARRIAHDGSADRLVVCGSIGGGSGWQCARLWL